MTDFCSSDEAITAAHALLGADEPTGVVRFKPRPADVVPRPIAQSRPAGAIPLVVLDTALRGSADAVARQTSRRYAAWVLRTTANDLGPRGERIAVASLGEATTAPERHATRHAVIGVPSKAFEVAIRGTARTRAEATSERATAAYLRDLADDLDPPAEMVDATLAGAPVGSIA